jgi:hypothetical protein
MLLETTNSSRNKTILGSDHQVIGSPTKEKYHFYKLIVNAVDKSPPSATMPCDLVSETGGKTTLEINKTWIIIKR